MKIIDRIEIYESLSKDPLVFVVGQYPPVVGTTTYVATVKRITRSVNIVKIEYTDKPDTIDEIDLIKCARIVAHIKDDTQ